MQEASDIKMYFYLDESGDPTILGHHGKNLLAGGKVSKTFMLGYVETSRPAEISHALSQLREALATDEYLFGIQAIGTSQIIHCL